MAMDLNSIPGESQDFGALDHALEEQLEVISEELFKKGTLSGDTIDWATVQTESTKVLAQASHMLAFRGLILSLIESAQQDSLKDAFEAGTILLSGHYPKLHPKGPKFQRKKASWALEIMTALTKALNDKQGQFDKGMIAPAGQAFCDAAALHELEVATLRKVLTEAASDQNIQKSHGDAASEQDSHSETPSKLDAKGRAQLRREIQTLAHKIFTNTPDAGISYEMRGFAGWMEFQFLPEADPSGKTGLQTMPSSVFEDHQRALSNPSLKDLQRLEERLVSNPDWFEGHRLASKLAEQLGLPAASEAIRRRVADRLRNWAGLRDLRYSNDAPFVSSEMAAWVGGQEVQKQTEFGDVSESGAGQGADLSEFLSSIDAELEAAKSPRDKGLAKLRLLREYKRLGHIAQAKLMAEELCDAICSASAKDWDEHLLKSIEAELS